MTAPETPPAAATADDVDASRAPLVAHLVEFRRRFAVVVLAWVAGFAVSYAFADTLYGWLVHPLAASFPTPEARRLIYTGLAEAFVTYVRLAAFGGFILAFPVLAGQMYRFLAPGLYRRERRALVPYLIMAPVLFLAGAALAYWYVLPLAWKFFVGFEQPGTDGALPIMLEARVGEYLALTMQFILAFGLAFQLPVILLLLARAGVVNAEKLARFRRYAVVLVVVSAAVLTPPDILSQVCLAVPLYALYEISILLCRRVALSRGP